MDENIVFQSLLAETIFFTLYLLLANVLLWKNNSASAMISKPLLPSTGGSWYRIGASYEQVSF